jgi:CRP-like cAMP-binding protein
MVSGMDTSAMDLFKDILALCKDHRCSFLLSGLQSDLKANLIFAGIKPTPGATRFRFSADLETALAQAEDGLLSSRFRWEEKDMEESQRRRRERIESTVEDGFLYALKKIDEQHGLNTLSVLRDFRDDTVPVELDANDILEREEGQGLYFVETGTLCIQPTSNLSTLRMSSPMSVVGGAAAFDPSLSLGAMHARPAPHLALQTPYALESRYRDGEQCFRLARLGQGSIIGTVEATSGLRGPCEYAAASSSSCRLHHLPPEAIRRAERDNPTLAMNLYKTLSHVATKREEQTIRQLGQLNRILRSPTPRLRGGKKDLGRIQNAL